MPKLFLRGSVIVALCIIALVAFFIWSYSTPLDKNGDVQVVTIEQGMGRDDVAQLLKDEKIIRNKNVFVAYTVLFKSSQVLQAGTYDLSSSMSIKDVVRALYKGGRVDEVRVVIPEGLTLAMVDEVLLEAGLIDEQGVFLEKASISSDEAFEIYQYEFLESLDVSTLEGFLFPDTYNFYKDVAVEDIIERLLYTFEKRINSLDQDIPLSQLGEVVTTASLLQAEVKTFEDMKMVAGVLENRMKAGMRLEIDATVVYATGKREIGNPDRSFESPYNTYRVHGLPPAPINSPGLDAIRATLNPTPSNYYYYISLEDGTSYFTVTFEEHLANARKYLWGG